MQLSRRGFVLGSTIVATAGFAAACGESSSSRDDRPSSGNDQQSIATDAYVFGYPLVLLDAARSRFPLDLPDNTFAHAEKLIDPTQDTSGVEINHDTLYSVAWLDLTTEPIVLQVPAMNSERFWIMQLSNAWGSNSHDPGSVAPQVRPATSEGPYTYVITGPQWSGSLPNGVGRMSMPTNRALLAGRVQVDGADDVPIVNALQRKMTLLPLSQWNRDPHATSRAISFRAGDQPAAAVAKMSGAEFFAKMCDLMSSSPPVPADDASVQRFSSIGIRAGAKPTDVRADLDAAAQAGLHRVTSTVVAKRNDNGWKFTTLDSDTDYLLRAGVAARGLVANPQRNALYGVQAGIACTDSSGRPLRYRITFASGQLPPVDAFWSITAYDADRNLVATALGEASIVGHPVRPTAQPDGSVEIAVQASDPKVPTGNWLTIPENDKFTLVIRLYAPGEAALSGQWRVPPLVEVH